MTHQKIEKLTVGIPNQYQLIGSKERNQFRKYNSSLVFQNFYMYTAVNIFNIRIRSTEPVILNVYYLLVVKGWVFFVLFSYEACTNGVM